jgi:AbrB family looped-hinge helix DNA binding protein
MRTTIDGAGRIVIPKAIRDALGLVGGTKVDLVIDGVAIRIEGPEPAEPELVDFNGRLVIKGTGSPFPEDIVDRLREERMDYLERFGPES